MILHRIKQESGLVSLHEEENLVIMLKVWFGSKYFGRKIIDLLLPKIASISIKVLINHYLKFYKISAWQVSWRFITQETNLQMFKSFLRLMKYVLNTDDHHYTNCDQKCLLHLLSQLMQILLELSLPEILLDDLE